MRSLFVFMCCLGLAPLSWSQGADGDFAQTAPPKVNVTLDSSAPLTEDAREAAAESDDQTIAEINAAWDAATTDSANAGETEQGSEDGPGFSAGTAALKATGSLLAVLALFVFLTYLVKRFGKRSPLLAGQQLGRVIGRVALSPQASLHFVRTNGEVLVVGVTPQSVSLLRTFDAIDFEPEAAPNSEAEAEPEQGPETNFLDQLRDVQESMGTMPGVDKDIDSLKGELQRLKQYFQDSARARE